MGVVGSGGRERVGAPTEQGVARRLAVANTRARSKAGFNLESFLDSAGLFRKQLVFQRNEVIFSQGDPAGNVFYIQKGIVKLSVNSDTGKTAVPTVFGPGTFVGIWCLAGQPRRMARVTAVSATTLRVTPKDEMLRLLRSDRHFSEYFINLMLARNIRATQQVVDLLCDDTEKRLIRALLFLAQFGVKNENDEVKLSGVSQELLGEMIGTSRTHVNGAMRRLKRMGFVEYNEGLRIHPTPLLSLL